MNKNGLHITALLFLATLFSCKQMQKANHTHNNHPVVSHTEWSKNANIYEVNIRQYTQEGTFKAFEKHIPRLKEMGVDILWLMPIQPIGVKNRKGSLGSHYSIQDYLKVNPNYGTMADFQHLVNVVHKAGMHIIIDWVANHTAFDNPLVTEHKDWYVLNEKGEPKPPVDDWTDVADLNYDNPELRRYMIDALKFWIQQANIDGYRCDVADMVPTSFWNEAKGELNALEKPIFMLAEAENPELHPQAFDMNYAWELHHIMNDICKGKKNVSAIDEYYAEKAKRFPPAVYRMNFTSNHDENSWNGTEYERMGSGKAVRCMGVFAATVPGMLLIYNGQEDSLTRRLKFFDKDAMQWGHYPLATFYKTLLTTKKNNPALWNGDFGGELKRIHTDKDDKIYAFSRTKGDHSVVVILNMSNENQVFTVKVPEINTELHDIFSKESVNLSGGKEYTLDAWEYRVYEK